MNDLPEGFDVAALLDALADGWGFEVADASYMPVGFGSYHWTVRDAAGQRRFVTVDDLDQKPWLGATREAALDGLARAFATAVALRDGGLPFVVAPIVTNGGEPLRRIGQRHTVALFPFVEGRAGESSRFDTASERAAVVEMLARLHAATPAVAAVARRAEISIPGRRHQETALPDTGPPWTGGPFSEPARHAVADHAAAIAALLATADRLAADVARRSTDWVVTHGEPHARNVIRADEHLLLVDWDTVALAPPERDLWMITGESGDEADAYAAITGRRLDEAAAAYYRLAWDIADLAAYIGLFRAPHRENDDTQKAYDELVRLLANHDR